MAKRKAEEPLVDVTDFDLTSPPVEGVVRKPRKALGDMTVEERLASKSLSQQLLGHYMTHYERKWGHPYFLVLDSKTKSPRRDLRILGDLGAQWGKEVVVQLIELFFTTTDPRVTRTSYATTDFQFHAPRLRHAQAGGDISEKTMSNIHEAAKAMGRKV